MRETALMAPITNAVCAVFVVPTHTAKLRLATNNNTKHVCRLRIAFIFTMAPSTISLIEKAQKSITQKDEIAKWPLIL
jgi:hypothetical protein